MTEPQKRIDGVRQQGCMVGDADQSMLVSVVAVDLMGASLWVVKRSGESRRIGGTPPGCPKIDSAWPVCFADGTARLCMAQADVGGGGASSHTVWLDFPGEVHPLPPAQSVAGGAYVAAPGGAITAINVAPFHGSTFLDLAALSVPPGATPNVQVQVVAPQAGRRALVGVASADTWQLVATAQAANVETTICGFVTPNASHAITIVADVGDLSRLEVRILGWLY